MTTRLEKRAAQDHGPFAALFPPTVPLCSRRSHTQRTVGSLAFLGQRLASTPQLQALPTFAFAATSASHLEHLLPLWLIDHEETDIIHAIFIFTWPELSPQRHPNAPSSRLNILQRTEPGTTSLIHLLPGLYLLLLPGIQFPVNRQGARDPRCLCPRQRPSTGTRNALTIPGSPWLRTCPSSRG